MILRVCRTPACTSSLCDQGREGTEDMHAARDDNSSRSYTAALWLSTQSQLWSLALRR